MKLTYKKATQKDLKTVLEAEKIAGKSSYYLAYTKKDEVKKYLTKSKVYIIQLDNKPIGHVSYKEVNKNTVEIDGLVVLPNYRKKGIAANAVGMIMEEIRSYNKVELLTHPHNVGSLLIYLKNGFVIESWEKNPFGDSEPRVKMVKPQK